MRLFSKCIAGLLFYLLSSALGTSYAAGEANPENENLQQQLPPQQPFDAVLLSDPSSPGHDFVGRLMALPPYMPDDLLDTSTHIPPWNISISAYA